MMAPIGSSLLDILEPPGNKWLQELMRSDKPLPAGVRVVRYEDGEREVFESGALPHRPGHKKEHDFPR
ncbi:MAG: hypothetical protein PHY45_02320 [Rhodocyclaceae bacterium]|nr:hypothetical protein [Rhodocyclaceae bacterium]